MVTLYENAWLLVLILSTLALLLMILKLWRSKKAKFRLDKDPSGFWRYHKETQFEKKDAYGDQLKEEEKKEKGKEKDSPKKEAQDPEGKSKEGEDEKSVVVVLDFDGDIRASAHKFLASWVDEIEVNLKQISEVVVCINSSGGMVAPYGHAFSEMERIRRLGLPLTVCIDVVAASGGYLMSLPANKILAAPFSIVGSIGVMAFVPNIREFLLKWNVQPRTFTAGKYKRTISLTDSASPEEVERFQGQLETIHEMFRRAVGKYRPQAKIEEVTTGEHWSAEDSLERELGLVDELSTSHSYLLRLNKDLPLVYIRQKKSFWDDGVGRFLVMAFDQIENRLLAWARQ